MEEGPVYTLEQWKSILLMAGDREYLSSLQELLALTPEESEFAESLLMMIKISTCDTPRKADRDQIFCYLRKKEENISPEKWVRIIVRLLFDYTGFLAEVLSRESPFEDLKRYFGDP